MKPIFYGDHERVELRKSTTERTCWTWQERDGMDEPQCTRLIGKGETYAVSTIFPGHDSGYADGGFRRQIKWVGLDLTWETVPVPPGPVDSVFCLPCCARWRNLEQALAWITQVRDGAAEPLGGVA